MQRAFGLILELRVHPNALELLSKAIAFLHMLARGEDRNTPPLMVSVRAVRLRKL